MCIVGLDLAWGDKRPDGYCVLRVEGGVGRIVDVGLVRGDEALVGLIRRHVGDGPGFLAMDGPVICVNEAGARPVDRLTHVHFGRFKSGCHPVNRRLCPRPLRVSARLGELGFVAGWTGTRCLAEVYPHPAMVRWFGLKERLPYKRGTVAEKRQVFRELQGHLLKTLAGRFPEVDAGDAVRALLQESWTKDIEDQTDAIVCALIGWWHVREEGRRSQVLGDLETGFLLVPEV
jgi:predicted RNase H-like nuclease